MDYRIHVPGYLTTSGKAEVRYYKTRAEAEEARGAMLAATRSESRVVGLSNAQTVDAIRAYERLAEAGLEMSLDRAVELALPVLRASGCRVTVEELFREFAGVKAGEWREKTARNFRFCAEAFEGEFGGRVISSITGKEIGVWLAGRYPHPVTRGAVLRTIRPAFSYAVQQEMIAASPFRTVVKPRVVRRRGVDVYTPEEARRLMEAAPRDCRGAFALMLFAGIRPAEVARLRWGDVRGEFVHITPDAAKTQQVRNVEIEGNLAVWLEGVRGLPEEPVCPKNWKRKCQEVRRVAGVSGRADAARHSYATYYLAKYKDENALKVNMGHSVGSGVLFAHYRAAATPREAEEFWGILPPEVGLTAE
ncbi:MAG: tyrosine-type recombinase/integrase [Akkermansia muciniphila]